MLWLFTARNRSHLCGYHVPRGLFYCQTPMPADTYAVKHLCFEKQLEQCLTYITTPGSARFTTVNSVSVAGMELLQWIIITIIKLMITEIEWNFDWKYLILIHNWSTSTILAAQKYLNMDICNPVVLINPSPRGYYAVLVEKWKLRLRGILCVKHWLFGPIAVVSLMAALQGKVLLWFFTALPYQIKYRNRLIFPREMINASWLSVFKRPLDNALNTLTFGHPCSSQAVGPDDYWRCPPTEIFYSTAYRKIINQWKLYTARAKLMLTAWVNSKI